MKATLLIFATFLALPVAVSSGSPLSPSEAPAEKAWQILQQGLASNRAEKRANAVHALRLLPNNPRAQSLAESALADRSPKVRAAAAKALGLMGAVSSAPKLNEALKD